MYPYPSGDLHIGHWYAMAPSDAHARFRRMQGYNVLHPIGFDAFGLPAENAAISRGIHPYEWTMSNVDNMRRQLRSIGAIYDWDREVVCCLPEYYRWNQWFFIKLYEKGLAYRAKAPVVWCTSCQTVLANEQVLNGVCERCEAPITRRDFEQWFFRITDYADELLDFSGLADWPDKILTMQRNWIGRSEGVEITFDISEHGLETREIRTFTTRIDTIFGVTFLALAPEHPLVAELTSASRREEVNAYIERARAASEIDRLSTDQEKTGVFTGAYARNRLNDERVPIYIADYVLTTYGTGAVMGVPAHDARDFDFARKYRLPIRTVIAPIEWDGSPPGGGLCRPRLYDQQRRLRRDDRRRRHNRHRRRCGTPRLGTARRDLPAARLADFPAALLGNPDSHGVLRRLRRAAGAGIGAARAAAGGRRVPPHRRIAPGPSTTPS